ncbi:MAG: AMP-binding protein [Acidobacteriota bacterium]|nr:AMP-binding protein [Acidobacteriota bacterium]
MTVGFSDPPATLKEALERAARYHPERGIAVFDSRGRRYERRTFPEVLASVQQSAGRWATLGLEPRDRVLVGLPTTWAFFECWIGALWRGAFPFAVASPGGFGAADAHVRKIEGLVDRLGVRHAVISDGFLDQAVAREATRLIEVAITPEAQAQAALGVGGPSDSPGLACGDCAFLQLTSGSTGLPRAVMVSHGAAIQNVASMAFSYRDENGEPLHEWADSLVSWLPMHHDMGLVGILWTAIVTGLNLWLFPPNAFLARPRVWLAEVGKHGKTATQAPNFGYQLCVERIRPEDREGLDLSGLRVSTCGAEMVRPETVAAFVEAFGPYGFDANCFFAGYGLAEASLGVTVDGARQGLRTLAVPDSGPDADEVVCLGLPMSNTQLRITDPVGSELPEGSVGELWVRSPALMMGYYEEPEATDEAIVDGWLRTGDLGFLNEGELYLTGRLKDVLIVRGTNFMPHELEWLAEAATGGGGSRRCAAFSVTRGNEGEEAVLVVEVGERDAGALEELEREIRLQVAHSLGINLADVVLVRRGQIPKTTSGKVQRRLAKEMYLRGELGRAEDRRSA